MPATIAPPTPPTTDARWYLWLVRDLAAVLAAEPADVDQHDARRQLVDRAVGTWQRTSVPDGAWEAAEQLLVMGDLVALTVGDRPTERSDADEYRDVFVGGVLRPLYRLIDTLTSHEYYRYSETEERELTKAERRELVRLVDELRDGVQRWAKATPARSGDDDDAHTAQAVGGRRRSGRPARARRPRDVPRPAAGSSSTRLTSTGVMSGISR